MAVKSGLWVGRQYAGDRDYKEREGFYYLSHLPFLMSGLLLDMRVSWTDITTWAQNKKERGL